MRSKTYSPFLLNRIGAKVCKALAIAHFVNGFYNFPCRPNKEKSKEKRHNWGLIILIAAFANVHKAKERE